MERSEVLLVEAQQFRDNATTVIYPRLFEFTEEARQVKKSRTVSVGPKRKCHYDLYWEGTDAKYVNVPTGTSMTFPLPSLPNLVAESQEDNPSLPIWMLTSLTQSRGPFGIDSTAHRKIAAS